MSMFADVPRRRETASLDSGDAIEIRIHWGGELLRFVELSPPRVFRIGDDAGGVPLDFVVPEGSGELGSEECELVVVDGGATRVRVPHGARAFRRTRPGAGGASPILEPEPILDRNGAIDVHVGNLVFSVRLAAREKSCPRAFFGDGDARGLEFMGYSLLGASALVAALAWAMPPFGLTDDEGLDRDRLYLLQQYLDAAAEREELQQATPADDNGGGGGPAAEAAKGAPGTLGKVESRQRNHRASGTEPGSEPRPATSRAEDLRAAESFGVIGILSSGAARPTSAPWDDPGVGDAAFAGGFFGDIGESQGSGGLTVGGLDQGGGQRGDTFALGGIGTCSGAGCMGMLGGHGKFGSSTGRDPGNHVALAPRLRPAGDTTVSGSLPPDVIQRIVRQSFGRFRGCYEDGLRTNPTLEGRVTARFVIARDGSVASVQPGSSDLPDARVVSCVLRAYSSLSFPAPKDGIVRVTYPLMFSPAA